MSFQSMVVLTRFQQNDFNRLISWIDNEELLLTIAGNIWSYPLTVDQLQHYLDDPKSYSFNIVELTNNLTVGHAEIVLTEDGRSCKIDKLLIDPTQRGKGLCIPVINKLLSYAFDNLPVLTVDLNVFDWNTAAIDATENPVSLSTMIGNKYSLLGTKHGPPLICP